MFRNMKLKGTLFTAFGLTIGISVVFIAAALGILFTSGSQYEDMLEREVVAEEKMMHARVYTNIIARNMREILMDPTASDIKELETDIEKKISQLDVVLEELWVAWPDGMDREMLNTYLDTVEAWYADVMEIKEVFKKGNVTEAARLVQEKCSPALKTMVSHAGSLNTQLEAQRGRVAEDIAARTKSIVIALIVVMVISAIAISFMIRMIIVNVIRPTVQVRDALAGFSEGDMTIEVDYHHSNELGQMCDALRGSQSMLRDAMADNGEVLEAMAHGDFTIRFKNDDLFVGGLSALRDSVYQLQNILSDSLLQIDASAEQVAAGANQVADGAQILAHGSTEQASAIQELSATIQDIASNARKNAERSEEAIDQANYAGLQVGENTRNMDEMIEAMNRISDSSQEIGKIIAAIENIAFQTNILALNAAVEAARAGSAGKGFAVVADEVRNLATKSDQAAKATKELINRSITSVEDGTKIVGRVSESLQKTVDATNKLKASIEGIGRAVENEAEAITQVTKGIDQISNVVQSNSATSEESAATSEELSGQASVMKTMMARFKLNRDERDMHMRVSAEPESIPAYSNENDYDDHVLAFSKY